MHEKIKSLIFTKLLLILLLGYSTTSAHDGVNQSISLSASQTKTQAIKKVLPTPTHIKGAHYIIAKITVNKNGEVTNVAINKGHPILANASESALKQWKFKSYKRKGEPIDFTGTVIFIFTDSKVKIK